MNMSKYYEYRKKIRALYDHEPCSSNDLGSKILELKDKNRCIVSMSLDLNAYYIQAQLEDDTPFEKINKICDAILRRIGYYIVDNIDSIPDLDPEDKDELRSILNNPSAVYCDHIIIGNMIKINL